MRFKYIAGVALSAHELKGAAPARGLERSDARGRPVLLMRERAQRAASSGAMLEKLCAGAAKSSICKKQHEIHLTISI